MTPAPRASITRLHHLCRRDVASSVHVECERASLDAETRQLVERALLIDATASVYESTDTEPDEDDNSDAYEDTPDSQVEFLQGGTFWFQRFIALREYDR